MNVETFTCGCHLSSLGLLIVEIKLCDAHANAFIGQTGALATILRQSSQLNDNKTHNPYLP